MSDHSELVKRLRVLAEGLDGRVDRDTVRESADAIERLTLELASARNPPEPGMPHVDLPERSPLRREVATLRAHVRVLREALERFRVRGPTWEERYDIASKALSATETAGE